MIIECNNGVLQLEPDPEYHPPFLSMQVLLLVAHIAIAAAAALI